MINSKFIIEIATSDYSTTASAVAGGADRIELCSNLAEGGTTPSFGTIKMVRETFTVSLFPIIRPRGGDFLYTDDEFETMLADAELCKQLGCDGIVTGLLLPNGEIDVARTALLIETVYPLSVTFHRAFDRCRDRQLALEQLISIGCERILTSGQQLTVTGGIDVIRELNELAAERIIIMPGSGVRADNIKLLQEKTGCVEFHSSLRNKSTSAMEFIHPSFKDAAESYSNNAILPEDVRALRSALEN